MEKLISKILASGDRRAAIDGRLQQELAEYAETAPLDELVGFLRLCAKDEITRRFGLKPLTSEEAARRADEVAELGKKLGLEAGKALRLDNADEFQRKFDHLSLDDRKRLLDFILSRGGLPPEKAGSLAQNILSKDPVIRKAAAEELRQCALKTIQTPEKAAELALLLEAEKSLTHRFREIIDRAKEAIRWVREAAWKFALKIVSDLFEQKGKEPLEDWSVIRAQAGGAQKSSLPLILQELVRLEFKPWIPLLEPARKRSTDIQQLLERYGEGIRREKEAEKTRETELLLNDKERMQKRVARLLREREELRLTPFGERLQQSHFLAPYEILTDLLRLAILADAYSQEVREKLPKVSGEEIDHVRLALGRAARNTFRRDMDPRPNREDPE